MINPKKHYLQFPDPLTAPKDEPACFGGDLAPDTLLMAYTQSYFPWFNKGEPILWWSPDPRMVLFPEKVKVSKSMRKVMQKGAFKITFNQDFLSVIEACRQVNRAGQEGTWISDEIIHAYSRLFQLGYVVSAEAWQGDKLVGGLYGVLIGKVFFGESMFSLVSNASKVAFFSLMAHLEAQEVQIVDCQVYTDHLKSLGAELMDRERFVRLVSELTLPPNLLP